MMTDPRDASKKTVDKVIYFKNKKLDKGDTGLYGFDEYMKSKEKPKSESKFEKLRNLRNKVNQEKEEESNKE